MRTLAHEGTHWTRHPTRLERDFCRKSWGDVGYAREELVAEFGAAFLCADLERQAARSSQLPRKAVDYLHGLQQPKAEAT